MPVFETIRENMGFEYKSEALAAQTLLEEDLIVPDIKPDIGRVLRVGGRAVIKEVTPSDERVGFSGELEVCVLYASEGGEKPVQSMTAAIPIDDFLNEPRAQKSSSAELLADIEHMEFRLINDRKINVKAVLGIRLFISNEEGQSVIKDIEAQVPVEMKKKTVVLDTKISEKKDRFTLKEELALPQGRPEISEILEVEAVLRDKEIRISDGKAGIRGSVGLSVLYTGEDEDSIIETAEYELPYSGFIEVKEAKNGMTGKAKLSVSGVSVKPVSDSDGLYRALEAEIFVDTRLSVYLARETEIVDDAYSVSRPMSITRKALNYSREAGGGKSESVIRETIQKDKKAPGILKAEKVWASAALDEVRLAEDRIICEGSIRAEVLYIAKDDENPVNIISSEIPFIQEVEAKGAREGMRHEVTAGISKAAVSLLSENELEFRSNLLIEGIVNDIMNTDVITEISEIAGDIMPPPIASVTIYAVQSGDTLWEIAKKYNTTVEDILLLNDIENPDIIYPGEKLLILKKIGE